MNCLRTCVLGTVFAVGYAASAAAQDPVSPPSQPRLTVWGGGLLMLRKDPGDQTLLVNIGVVPIFDASQFNFDIEPGGEGGINFWLSDRLSIGASAFGIDGWDDDRAVASASGAGILYSNGGAGAFGPPTNSDLDYESNLLSVQAEVGLKSTDWLTFFAGPRYIRIEDNLHVSTVTGAFFANNTQLITNELFGGQLGATGTIPLGERLSLLASVAGGAYLNDVDSKIAYDANFGGPGPGPGGPLALEFNPSESNVAVAFDASIDAQFRLSQHLLLGAGYQALFVDGVAVATQQPIVNPVPLPAGVAPNEIDSNSSAIFHGPRARVLITW